MFRSPQEVIASYLGQGWIKGLWKRRTALNYWRRFNQSLLHIYYVYQDKKPIYILNYNEDIIAQTTLLCEKLGIKVTPEAKSLFNLSYKHYTSDKFPKEREVMDVYKALMDVRMVNQ